MILILLVLLILFGFGGGIFYNDGAYRGPGIGLGGFVLIILLVWLLFGPAHHWTPLY